jgi:hypothetical protein
VVEALPRRELMQANGNGLPAQAAGHLLFRVGAVLVLTLLMTVLYAGAAWAETFTVTNTSDSGEGSLRAGVRIIGYVA